MESKEVTTLTELTWHVSAKGVYGPEGEEIFGTGETPELALDHLVGKIVWQRQLWDERLELAKEAKRRYQDEFSRQQIYQTD